MPIQTALDSISNNGSPFGFKNRIINGAMVIDQRGSSSSPITSGGRAYAVDRWCCEKSGAGAFTFGQSSTAPTGFKYSSVCTVSTADTSIASGDIYWFEQRIEGYNTADWEWGTANAKTITISFWVRSSVTGTYTVTPSYTVSRTFEYTINNANTWEYKTIVIPGPTSSYSGSTTNGTGMNFRWALACGSTYAQAPGSWTTSDIIGSTNQVNWMATVGNTFYITGVQVEVGSTATSFDYRSYTTESQLCRRYFQKSAFAADWDGNSWAGSANGLPVSMRATPTLSNVTYPLYRSNIDTSAGTNGVVVLLSSNDYIGWQFVRTSASRAFAWAYGDLISEL